MHAKCPKVAFPVACLVLLHVTNTSALGVPALDKKKSMAICQAEIKQKLISFVKDTYHGAIAGFFRHYDTNGDKGLDEREVSTLLYDCNIMWICRWSGQVVKHFDSNRDGKVQVSEILSRQPELKARRNHTLPRRNSKAPRNHTRPRGSSKAHVEWNPQSTCNRRRCIARQSDGLKVPPKMKPGRSNNRQNSSIVVPPELRPQSGHNRRRRRAHRGSSRRRRRRLPLQSNRVE